MITNPDKEISEQEKSNLYLRFISGLSIVAIFVISILWYKILFTIIMIIVASCMFYEWLCMTKFDIYFTFLGIIIILPSIISLILINNYNHYILINYFTIIWSVDTFAMIGGKTIGGVKLAAKISPNKTWSGFFIGIISSAIMSLLVSKILEYYFDFNFISNKLELFIYAIVIGIISQISDLFISHFKRKFHIKDTGNIIPGHGGMLDRFDSIILTAPIQLVILYYM
jgi:phosphatidate cytidylyltransferase